MAINAIQAAIRSMTGTERQFNGDLHAYWDQLGIPPGQFAERMVVWKQLPQNAAWIAATEDADAPEGVDGLWRNGEQGVWYEAGDLSTMFQDAAGTLQVYAPGQGQVDPPVGRILDKSGRGNHAYQTTTTSRPTLSARYNLLTNTSFAGAIAGAPGTAPTGWVFSFTTGEISAVTPLGPDFAIQIATSATRLVFTQQLTAAPNVAYSHWIDVLETTAIAAINFIALTAQPSGATVTYWFNGELITSSTVISSPGRLEMRMTVGSTGGNYYVRFGVGCSGNTTGVATIARPDVRVTNDGVGLPPYQRVVDANTYDTVGFPLYLRFDGVDDWLQTASIDFTTTDKVIAATALRKLSDAAVGMAFELSATAAGNNGAFFMAAPITASVANLYWRSNGTIGSAAASPSTYPAPVSSILAGLGDISGDKAILRVNGSQVAQGLTDQGAGAYGNYPLYIGRRAGTSLSFNGRLYGLLIRGAATPDATIAKVEGYLNSKARIY